MQLTTTRSFAPATMGEAIEFSKMLADSSMVPKAYQGKPQDIMVCVQWGYELGLAPMQALQNIAVINGKPSIYGDAMAALVQASPVCEGIDESFEGTEGTGEYTAVCIARRKGRNPVIVRFSVNDAKRAGLWGKQGPWQSYPKRMLQMRARGFALRDAFPDVLKGLITAEEAEDYPSDSNAKEKDITPAKPANPLDTIAPPAPAPVVIAPAVEDAEIIDVAPVVAEFPPFDEPVVELQNDSAEPAEPVAEPDAAPGVPLMVPDQKNRVEGEPPKLIVWSVWPDLAAWADAYEDMADKTARAGKREHRERLTLLKELRNANAKNLERLDPIKRLRHTAAYSRRLAAIGAAMTDE